MKRRSEAIAALLVILLAMATAACGPPSCPPGYWQMGDRCYRMKKDAGAEAGFDGELGDSGEGQDGASAVVVGDAGGAGDGDGGSDLDADLSPCALECGEHRACQVIDGVETCACATGYTSCEGESECMDLTSDPLNCGSCGYACAQGLSCKQGECEQRIRELVLDMSVSCALYDSPDGNYPLKCWGDGQYGLFREGAVGALTPRQVPGVPRVRALALFGAAYCMIVPGEDKIRCWGAGSGATSASAFSADISLAGVRRVSGAGAESTDGWGTSMCALHGVGDVSCWGAAPLNGASENRAHPQGTINIDNTRTFIQLDGGYVHTCGVAADGRVGCWGATGWQGADGTLGVPNDSFGAGASWSSGVFVQKEQGGSLTGVVKVAAGIASCAVTETGELWCWGPNAGGWRASPGLLGVGDEEVHQGAVKVPLEDVVDVALGWGAQACALQRGGQVFCWGSVSGSGQGAGAVGDSEGGWAFTRPRAVPDLSDVIEIQAGAEHTCARKRNGQVLCWGQNSSGELGDGTKVERLSPTPVIGLYE